MTFKEKLQMEHPEYVDEKFCGGCRHCPYHYGYEKKLNCERMESYEKCKACWNREMPNEELVKTVPLPMPPITEPKKEVDAADYIEIYTDGHKKGYDEGLNDAWEFMGKYAELTCIETQNVYGVVSLKLLTESYTPQEALAKLKAYEEQIKVGDVVTYAGEKCVVLDKRGSKLVVLMEEGVYEWYECDVEKTDKHIDIKSFLEQIRGE